MSIRRLVPIFFCLLLSSIRAEEKPDFLAEVKKNIVANNLFFQQQNNLALSDRLFEANAELVKRADAEQSPYFDFIVANKLYGLDPEAAYRLHQRVFKAFPTVPEVNLEWAMVCHRRGELQPAIAAYQLYLKANPTDPVWALLADCLVRAGKSRDAVAAWAKANHARNHVAIEKMICSIYAGIDPLRKRADILQAVEKGAATHEALILQDLNMENDWWNSHIYFEGLDRDLARAAQALGKESRRYKEMDALAILGKNDKVTEKDIFDQHRSLHVLVVGGAFPVNSAVAAQFIRLAVEHKLVAMDELLKRYGPELEDRATSKEGDVEALNILCVLHSSAENWKDVKKFDRYGWDRYKDVRFARSYLAELLRDKELTLETPDLKKAFDQFPEDAILWTYRLHVLGEQVELIDVLGAIQAEFRHLSVSTGVTKDSSKLKALFIQLERKIGL
jgi:hypothetical protein